MPKKKTFTNNLSLLREAMDLSQSEFARCLGVSASIIKKVEEGKRSLSAELSAKIYAETGVLFFSGTDETSLEYTKADHVAWKKEVLFDQKSIQPGCRVITKLVNIMLSAATRPGVDKSYVVFAALIQAIERVKNEYGMEKHIDAELRDRQQTETKLYTVRELRRNPLLAKQVGFKDDPALKNEENFTGMKTLGWLPTKEFFNIEWQHLEFMRELLLSQDAELTDVQKTTLDDIDKQREAEIAKFLPR